MPDLRRRRLVVFRELRRRQVGREKEKSCGGAGNLLRSRDDRISPES
jgi:hypothetical protein